MTLSVGLCSSHRLDTWPQQTTVRELCVLRVLGVGGWGYAGSRRQDRKHVCDGLKHGSVCEAARATATTCECASDVRKPRVTSCS